MTAHGYVPDELKNIPFTVEQARSYGINSKAAARRLLAADLPRLVQVGRLCHE
jgi:hypothetical protein